MAYTLFLKPPQIVVDVGEGESRAHGWEEEEELVPLKLAPDDTGVMNRAFEC